MQEKKNHWNICHCRSVEMSTDIQSHTEARNFFFFAFIRCVRTCKLALVIVSIYTLQLKFIETNTRTYIENSSCRCWNRWKSSGLSSELARRVRQALRERRVTTYSVRIDDNKATLWYIPGQQKAINQAAALCSLGDFRSDKLGLERDLDNCLPFSLSFDTVSVLRYRFEIIYIYYLRRIVASL